MEIKKTERHDVCGYVQLIQQAQQYLKSQGIDQWQNGYPNEEVILQDMDQEESYVLVEDDQVFGGMAVSFRGEKNYFVIDGAWKSQGPYGVIHRIVVEESKKGQGLATQLLQFAYTQAIDKNIDSIRIDTHADNWSMQRWLIKNGFEFCGIIQLQDLSERYAYEKKVSEENEV